MLRKTVKLTKFCVNAEIVDGQLSSFYCRIEGPTLVFCVSFKTALFAHKLWFILVLENIPRYLKLTECLQLKMRAKNLRLKSSRKQFVSCSLTREEKPRQRP